MKIGSFYQCTESAFNSITSYARSNKTIKILSSYLKNDKIFLTASFISLIIGGFFATFSASAASSQSLAESFKKTPPLFKTEILNQIVTKLEEKEKNRMISFNCIKEICMVFNDESFFTGIKKSENNDLKNDFTELMTSLEKAEEHYANLKFFYDCFPSNRSINFNDHFTIKMEIKSFSIEHEKRKWTKELIDDKLGSRNEFTKKLKQTYDDLSNEAQKLSLLFEKFLLSFKKFTV